MFEFLKANLFNTTTQAVINNATDTVSYILNPNPMIQYISSGMNDDNTTVSLTVSFDATQTVSRIALMEHNLKDFRIFYNGVTANVFALTSTSNTTTTNYISNSETSQYFRFASVDCTSVTFDFRKTMSANAEKAIGHLIVSDTHYVFSYNPSAKNYDPSLVPKQTIHAMSDGGTKMHTVDKKWETKIKLSHINSSFRNSLKTVYDLQSNFIFCPFGTTTSWDKIIFNCVWSGPFTFYEYSENASSAGFSGTITLRETPI